MPQHLKFYFSFSFLVVCLLVQVSAQTPQPAATARDFFEQGLTFVKAQKFDEALAAFRRSAQLDAAQASTQMNIGVTLAALGRAAESIAPLCFFPASELGKLRFAFFRRTRRKNIKV